MKWKRRKEIKANQTRKRKDTKTKASTSCASKVYCLRGCGRGSIVLNNNNEKHKKATRVIEGEINLVRRIATFLRELWVRAPDISRFLNFYFLINQLPQPWPGEKKKALIKIIYKTFRFVVFGAFFLFVILELWMKKSLVIDSTAGIFSRFDTQTNEFYEFCSFLIQNMK